MFACNRIFLILLLSWTFRQRGWTSVVQQHLLKQIDELCPGANICRTNGTTAPNDYPAPTSCCADCSCSESCSMDDNCCFPETDNRNSQKNRACISTLMSEPQQGNHAFYKSYYMYTDVPTGGCLDKTITTIVLNDHVAPWVKLFPVYSNNNGKLYMNSYLAECYGESDLLKWRTVVSCPMTGEGNTTVIDMATSVETIFSDSTSHCIVHIEYPGDKRDIEAERCYLDIIDSCSNTSFEVPSGINLSRDEVRQACESGLFSPYVDSANFANVFCAICNMPDFEQFQQCNIDTRDLTYSHFLYLLDADIAISIHKKRQKLAKQEQNTACPNSESLPSECRIIHCPTGQLRRVNGTCVWPFSTMLNSHFVLFLKLDPDIPIPAVMIAKNDSGMYKNWLISPWPYAWSVITINYETTGGGDPIVTRIWIEQSIYPKDRRIDTLIRNIRNILPERWTASIDGWETGLNQTIDVFKTFYKGYSQCPGGTTEKNATIHTLYGNKWEGLGAVLLTKTFFCDQVELLEHEYVLNPSTDTVVYIRTNRTLHDGEFSIVKTADELYVVRICLEDSDFILRVSGCLYYNLNCRIVLLYLLATLLLL